MRKAIVHYRDDLDLQNLMDYIQKEVPTTLRLTQDISDQRLVLFSKHPNRKPESRAAYVIFGFADSFPHDMLNVT